MVGCLFEVKDGVEEELFDGLAERMVVEGRRGLSRSDQCVGLCGVSRLFEGGRAGEVVEEAVRRARLCVSGGERVMLLLGCIEVGACAAQTGWNGGEVLRIVLEEIREGLTGKSGRWSLGKVAGKRYTRTVAWLRGLDELAAIEFGKL